VCGREDPLAATHFFTLNTTTKRLIQRLSDKRLEAVTDLLIVGQEITPSVNREKLLFSAYSPGNLRQLAYGYLLSAGMIRTTDDVISDREEEGAILGDVRPFWMADDLSPTVQAAKLEDKLRICLFGFVRGERLNILRRGSSNERGSNPDHPCWRRV